MNINRIIKHRDLRDSSLQLYIKYGARLAKHLYPNKKEPKISGKDINDNQALIDLFVDTLSHHQKKLLLSTMLIILSPKGKKRPMERWKSVYNHYNEMLKIIHKKYTDERKQNVKNEKEEKNWMEWEEVILTLLKLKEEYEQKNKWINFKRYIALALYCYDSNPPRRLEYCYTKIIKENAYKKLSEPLIKNNIYIVIPDGEINMYFSFGVNKVKIKKYSVKQLVPLGDELNEILFNHCKKHIGEYLFPNRRNKKICMTTGSFTSLLKSLFEKNISVTMLRKIYISFAFRNYIKLYQKIIPGDKREIIADLMGHSALQQMNTYLKQ